LFLRTGRWIPEILARPAGERELMYAAMGSRLEMDGQMACPMMARK